MKQHQRIHVAYAKIFRHLLEGPGTIDEMCREDDKPRPAPKSAAERMRAMKQRRRDIALRELQAILTPTPETV